MRFVMIGLAASVLTLAPACKRGPSADDVKACAEAKAKAQKAYALFALGPLDQRSAAYAIRLGTLSAIAREPDAKATLAEAALKAEQEFSDSMKEAAAAAQAVEQASGQTASQILTLAQNADDKLGLAREAAERRRHAGFALSDALRVESVQREADAAGFAQRQAAEKQAADKLIADQFGPLEAARAAVKAAVTACAKVEAPQ